VRRFAYSNCECGALVRLARVPEDSEPGRQLQAVDAVGFVAECPACKATATLTFKPASVIERPRLVTLEGGAT
jgi:hypothetical protein